MSHCLSLLVNLVFSNMPAIATAFTSHPCLYVIHSIIVFEGQFSGNSIQKDRTCSSMLHIKAPSASLLLFWSDLWSRANVYDWQRALFEHNSCISRIVNAPSLNTEQFLTMLRIWLNCNEWMHYHQEDRFVLKSNNN